jgi:hypothetical protein
VFELYRISNDVDADTRLTIIETHWPYFLGFGLPYVLLFKFTSFFIGYGIFLAIFPFGIMMGSLSDYKEPYLYFSVSTGPGKNDKKKNKKTDTMITDNTIQDNIVPPMEIFHYARVWTLASIKTFNEYSGIKKLMNRKKKNE